MSRRATAISTTTTDVLEPFRERLLWCSSHALDDRFDIVRDAFVKLGEPSFWRLLGEEWTYWETNYQLLKIISSRSTRAFLDDIRMWFMTVDELAAYNALPNRIEVWRGCSSIESVRGLSWTNDRAVAEKFARYSCGGRRNLIGTGGRNPILASATVRKTGVFAVKLDRNESELIVLPGAFVVSPTTTTVSMEDRP